MKIIKWQLTHVHLLNRTFIKMLIISGDFLVSLFAWVWVFYFIHLFTYLLCRQLCCLQIDCLCISFYCLHVLAVTSSSLLNMSGRSSYFAPAMTCFSYCRKIIESGRRNTLLLLHYYEYFWFCFITNGYYILLNAF